jgi:acetyl-CoA carboxylase biotin carboxyl carrier protein
MPAKKAPPARGQAKTTSTHSELDLIRSLASILNETGLSEIELDQKGTRVRVSKTMTAYATVAPTAHAPTPIVATPIAVVAKAPDADHAGTVKSPMVGTIYMASAPGSPDFISVGATVKQGQTLMIIEAMKTMNQIPSPASGKVTKIFVGNGDPVEYGAPLVVIE